MRQKVQIIGGEYRSRRLEVMDADGLRPTSSRMREMLFNWLQMRIPGTIAIDLFAGTGALGIEALSRGAKKVFFVEKNPKVFALLKRNITSLKIPDTRFELFNTDAHTFLEQSMQYSDLLTDKNLLNNGLHLFVDPPFFAGIYEETLDKIAKSELFCHITSLSIEMPARNLPKIADQLTPLISYRKKGSKESTMELFIRP